MPRTGRPKSENPRNKNVFIRLTEEEHERIMAYAAKRGCTMTKLMLDGFEALLEKEEFLAALDIVRANKQEKPEENKAVL